jgi:hypothetical protein
MGNGFPCGRESQDGAHFRFRLDALVRVQLPEALAADEREACPTLTHGPS